MTTGLRHISMTRGPDFEPKCLTIATYSKAIFVARKQDFYYYIRLDNFLAPAEGCNRSAQPDANPACLWSARQAGGVTTVSSYMLHGTLKVMSRDPGE